MTLDPITFSIAKDIDFQAKEAGESDCSIRLLMVGQRFISPDALQFIADEHRVTQRRAAAIASAIGVPVA